MPAKGLIRQVGELYDESIFVFTGDRDLGISRLAFNRPCGNAADNILLK
jgi:hypothetical protein